MIRNSAPRRLALVAGVVMGAIATLVVALAPSAAASYNNVCIASGGNCLLYDQNYQGANINTYGNITDFANPPGYFGPYCGNGYKNPGPCDGHGQPVWNDVASDINNEDSLAVRVYYNPNYGGTYYALGDYQSNYNWITLGGNAMLNNNRSQLFFN